METIEKKTETEVKPIIKAEKKMMSESEASILMDSWADRLEIKTTTELFSDVKETIMYAVQKERLSFNSDDNTFTYCLLTPIKMNDGSNPISIVTLTEMDIKVKEVLDRIDSKKESERTAAGLAALLGIELGFAARVKDRDLINISATAQGFFVGAGK